MKGIIPAAGMGTRFYPATLVISKQLLPLYDKPLIYYPLAVLMQAGVREVMIIVTEQDLPRFEQLLNNGARLGLDIRYRIQPEPLGIPDAFHLTKDYTDDEPIMLILGDSMLHGAGLGERIAPPPPENGLTMFAHSVDDPQNYGVFELAEDGPPVSITDKPAIAMSNLIAIGLYYCTPAVVELARALHPQSGREMSLDDVVRPLFEAGKVEIRRLEEGFAWFDTGTPERLYSAARFVREIEERLGTKIACLEQVALEQGFIDLESFARLVEPMPDTSYSRYLKRLL